MSSQRTNTYLQVIYLTFGLLVVTKCGKSVSVLLYNPFFSLHLFFYLSTNLIWPTRMIFASAVLTELCPRIVDHRAHHLFDETLPRTADVFDRSTRATGQPPAAARFVLIRELHPLGTEMTRALSTANCHAAMEMTRTDEWSVCRRINVWFVFVTTLCFLGKKQPSVHFFFEALLMPTWSGVLSASLVNCVADKEGRTKMHQDG